VSKPVAPLSEFAALRRAGISYAQEASGDIWTDYNVHDPGVTLLEQTCFALSQIAYQVSLPTRDLLTNARGHFCAQDLALFRPRKVLATNPVTRSDLAAWLCACPEIESVSIDPEDPEKPGRYDLTIVPSTLVGADADLTQAFRAAFADARPLGAAPGDVRIARPVDVTLTGHIEITSEALPETVAAALYHRVGQILSGLDHQEIAATRADVWSAPERLLAPAQTRSQQSLDLSRHLADLRKLPGIHDIETLTLTPNSNAEHEDPSGPVYYRVNLPARDTDVAINLYLGDAPVAPSAARLREEFIRISAQTIARAKHHIDRIDWDVMRPGRHRQFTHANVDALLPSLYRTKGSVPQDRMALFEDYREAINHVLHDMVETLKTLPARFAPASDQTDQDPARHRLRRDLLDYLIALQGSEMPPTRHSGLHTYMSRAASHRFEITWRLEYLFALPVLHRARATGPGPKTPGGFLSELAILCDLDVTETGIVSSQFSGYGLSIDTGAELAEEAEAKSFTLISAHNPFDMLVPETDNALPFTPEDFAPFTGFLEKGRVGPELLARMTETDCFAIAPHTGGQWVILLDAGALAPLRRIAVRGDKAEALQTVARLRATWRHLARSSEACHLVERALLPGTRGAECAVADLVLPGWTPRCSQKSYRRYVSTQVERLAPAHLHIRLHWLTPAEQQAFETLVTADTQGTAEQSQALRDFLDTRVQGAAD